MLNLKCGKIVCKRLNIRWFFFFCVVLFQVLQVQMIDAQFVTPGQLPADRKLIKLSYDNFSLVTTKGNGDLPFKSLMALESALKYDSSFVLPKFRRFTVWINPEEIRSNGRVAWAPRRMELFSMPPQDQEPGNWIEHLTVHETHHVKQMEYLKKGPLKVLSWVFGEQAIGVGAGLLPLWYLEGDAVVAENMAFPSARGTMPSFTMIDRTELLSEEYGSPGYSVSMLGSYKRPSGGHYPMGYTMAASIRDSFGAGVLYNAVENVARRPYLITPFSYSLKQQTGLNSVQWYEHAKAMYSEAWKEEFEMEPTPFKRLNMRFNKSYVNYSNPVWLDDSTCIVQKQGIGMLRSFVILRGLESEKTLHIPYPSGGGRISSGGGIIVWTEYLTHVRWTGKSRSVVKAMDVRLNKQLSLEYKESGFSPSLTADGSKMVLVNVSSDNTHNLVIISMPEGREYARYSAPGDEQIQMPVWYNNNTHIVAVLNSSDGQRLASMDIASGEWSMLTECSFAHITDLTSSGQGKQLFFTGDSGKVSNIYVYTPENGISQITRSLYGASSPSVNRQGTRLLYSDYTPRGYDVVETVIDTSLWSGVSLHGSSSFLDRQAQRLYNPIKMDTALYLTYKIKESEYRKWQHPFRLHSWAPFYYDYKEMDMSDPDIMPGFVLVSQNTTGTVSSIAGMSFREEPLFHTRMVFRGWYPVFELDADIGGKQGYAYYEDVTRPRTGTRVFMSAGTYIPLSFPLSRGVFRIYPSYNLNYSNDLLFNGEKSYTKGLSYTKAGLQASLYRYSSSVHIAPPLGISGSVQWFTSPIHDNGPGDMWTFKSIVWLPGLAPFHSVRVTSGYQRQESGTLLYSSELDFPRGHYKLPTTDLTRVLAEYSFPWAYPDFEVGSGLYIKRLRSAVFGDWAYNKPFNYRDHYFQSKKMTTAGADVIADFHILGLPMPFSAGTRVMYMPSMPSNTKWAFEVLFSMDITGF